MNEMATTDIVIHKGEKEEKYELYVEDYVMSYLKNYKETGSEKIFFYGKREKGNQKYYIYGAGRQKEISYFEKYELLDEVSCHFVMDMPVFSVKENTRTYDVAGYYIFYQSNEAMQNYMVEQRKIADYQEKTKGESPKAYRGNEAKFAQIQEKRAAANKTPPKTKGGLMPLQLAAIFVVLVAIVINSTNSYTKLEELNQAAVEVFFAMENQEASGSADTHEATNTEEKDKEEENGEEKEDVLADGTILRLEDLDTKFEEENMIAKQDGEENAGLSAQEPESAGEASSEGSGQNIGTTQQDNTGADTENGAERQEQSSAAGDSKAGQNAADRETASAEEAAPSKQAFARNFAEYYQIEKGDTLYTISIKIYGDTSRVKEICELNQIKDPDNIKYGQKILLP